MPSMKADLVQRIDFHDFLIDLFCLFKVRHSRTCAGLAIKSFHIEWRQLKSLNIELPTY